MMPVLTAVGGRYEYASIDEKHEGSDGGGVPTGRHLRSFAMDIERLRDTRLSTTDERVQRVACWQAVGQFSNELLNAYPTTRGFFSKPRNCFLRQVKDHAHAPTVPSPS